MQKVENLRKQVQEKYEKVEHLEAEFDVMNDTINSYLEMTKDKEAPSGIYRHLLDICIFAYNPKYVEKSDH